MKSGYVYVKYVNLEIILEATSSNIVHMNVYYQNNQILILLQKVIILNMFCTETK